jgi:hypothetical protein
VDPQPYLEFNYLVKHAKAVITDSGGITEETTVMGVPCLTLRDSTERPETVTTGTNELIGTNPAALAPALDKLFAGQWKKGAIPEKWDGHTGRAHCASAGATAGPQPQAGPVTPMALWHQAGPYWHTLRHLRPVQFYGRVWFPSVAAQARPAPRATARQPHRARGRCPPGVCLP